MTTRPHAHPQNVLRDIATFDIIHVHGVSVRKIATALEVSRQTVYRRMKALLHRARQQEQNHSDIKHRPYNLHTERKAPHATDPDPEHQPRKT